MCPPFAGRFGLTCGFGIPVTRQEAKGSLNLQRVIEDGALGKGDSETSGGQEGEEEKGFEPHHGKEASHEGYTVPKDGVTKTADGAKQTPNNKCRQYPKPIRGEPRAGGKVAEGGKT